MPTIKNANRNGAAVLQRLLERQFACSFALEQAQPLWLEVRARMIADGFRSSAREIEQCEDGCFDTFPRSDPQHSLAMLLAGCSRISPPRLETTQKRAHNAPST